MFPGHDEMTVGRQNITAVETALRQNDIPVVMKSCGGELGRRVTIDVATGSMDIEFTGDSEHHNPTCKDKSRLRKSASSVKHARVTRPRARVAVH